MAYERLAQRRRYTHSAVRRAWLYCLLIALPALLFAAILIFRAHISTAPALLIVGSLLLYLLLLLAFSAPPQPRRSSPAGWKVSSTSLFLRLPQCSAPGSSR